MSRYSGPRSMVTRLILVVALLALAQAFVLGCAQKPTEAAYPSKAIQIIVPYAAGGGTDLVARIAAEYAQSKWGQPITVVNKPGGGGTPGMMEMLQAPPDGYVLTMLAAGTSFLNPAIQLDLPYKWDGVTFLSRLTISPLVLVVKADSPHKTVKDLVEAIRKDPSKFKFASSGVGGPSTFGVAQLLQAAGIDPTKVDVVPFDGGTPSATAVAGGHVDFAAQNLSEVLSMVKGGQLRALAVTTPARVTEFPDVPTAKEAGYEGFNQVGVFGMAGPPKLPESVVAKWDSILDDAMKDSTAKDKMLKTGNPPAYMASKEYKAWTGEQAKTANDLAIKLKLQK
jgi:tripartite-type tricarboxylate transporter receptor subunit TctC